MAGLRAGIAALKGRETGKELRDGPVGAICQGLVLRAQVSLVRERPRWVTG